MNMSAVLKKRRWILGVLIFPILIIAAYFIFSPRAKASLDQPIAFNHQVMVQLGIDCLFCHTEARRSPAAGMPSVEKCMGCHKVIDPTNPEIQKVASYWERQEAIPWERVNRLPRFVYFSHQVHIVVGGLNCEKCHGDVGHMTIAKPVAKMDMGWCLDCHELQANTQQLRDCVVCHQ